MTEFDMIAEYFAPLTRGRVALDDDAAVLNIPVGKELVVSSDTLNAGVHFFANGAPGDIARKALRVNLSDMAAMGAQPFCYQLAIAFPEVPSREWLAEFSAALAEDQERFGVFCSGGDTTSLQGALSISITMMGLVETGAAWKRGGARVGDQLVLTGPVGDAWIGLEVLRGAVQTVEDDYFVRRYYEPVPQFILHNAILSGEQNDGVVLSGDDRCCDVYSSGNSSSSHDSSSPHNSSSSHNSSSAHNSGFPHNSSLLHPNPPPAGERGCLDEGGGDSVIVHAAIDVSDGVIADLGHVCRASGVGAWVDLSAVVFSDPARRLIDEGAVTREQLLSGGDDYQLLLAVPDGVVIEGAQVIGEFVEGTGVVVVDEKGCEVSFEHTGWSHF